jgi:hypothetical protein
MSELPVTAHKPKPHPSILLFLAIVVVALACSCGLCAIPFAGALGNSLENIFSQSGDDPGIGDFFNSELTPLYTDLDADSRVTNAETNLKWYTGPENGQNGGWYLTIDVSTLLTCTSGESDPCAKLVDDVARMVFKDYRKADRLAGMTVSITQHTTVGNIDYSETPMAKSLSMLGWRKTLGIESPAVSQ